MSFYLNLCSGGGLTLGLINALFPSRLHLQKGGKFLSNEKRNLAESKIRELANKLTLSKPVELREIKGFKGGAQAQGMAFLPGKIGITFDPELINAMPDAELEFLMAHELSHIKANDNLTLFLIPGIIGVITTLAMIILFPSSAHYFSKLDFPKLSILGVTPAATIGLTVSLTTFIFFSRWREECADRLGFSICSESAQAGASSFFKEIRSDQLEYRNDQTVSVISRMWRKVLITKRGNFRLDILHPPLTKRINYLSIGNVRA